MQSIRADTTLAPKDRRAKAQSIKQDSENRIESILSDAQRQQYEQMKQDHRNKKEQRATVPANS